MTATIEHTEAVSIEDLKEKVAIPRKDFEKWLEKHNWTYHQIARGDLPPGYDSLLQFQTLCINMDPVLWCRVNMREPKDPKKHWGFWGYQKPSIRDEGNTIHEDASEVGKTREVEAFILYNAFTVPNGSGLLAAPMYTHLLPIINEILKQLRVNPMLSNSLVHHTKHPHHQMEFSNGFILDFTPVGHDGESLRNKHYTTFIIMEEAAKIKNSVIWDEFFRSAEPDCTTKLYSVPDGDRSTEYYRLCKAAGNKNNINDEEENENELSAGADIEFTKYHWPKTLMPAPFWNEQRRRSYIKRYGGEDSPGYQRNCLGQWGDQENSVFPWHQFERLLRDIPEYRCLKILVDDSQGTVSITGTRYVMPELNQENGTSPPGGRAGKPQEQIICDKEISKGSFDIKTEIKTFFTHIAGSKYAGVDLGYSKDPTEILVKLIFGKMHRKIARIQLKGVTYDQQADAIDAVDDIYDAGALNMGWGLDYGNAGSAITQILQGQDRYILKQYDNRLTGYEFQRTYDAVDEDGEVLMNKHTGKPVKLTGKEMATDLLVGKMQRLELEYPYDPDIMLDYPNHTYTEGKYHRVYRKGGDHIIDADRFLMLRIVLPGEGVEDIFARAN